MLVLYHHPFLPSCRFARLILSEYRVEHELLREPFWEHRTAFLALNPAGTLPIAHAPGADPIVGAEVLMEYLEETEGAGQGDRRLLPEVPQERAEVRRLVAWFEHKFAEEVSGPFAFERILKVEMPSRSGGGAPDSTILRTARQNLRGHLNYLAHLLRDRNWIAHERISFADLAAAAGLSCLDYLGEVPWDEEDAVKEWYQRIKSRPSFRPLLQDVAKMVRPADHYVDLDF